MRRALPLAAALVVAAANARAKPVPHASTARQDFLAGVEAHLKEDNDAAAKDWARCLKKAAKGSDDESDCRLFAGMVQEQLAPNAPVPDPKSEARRAYVEGRDAYLRKDYATADLRWHDCLGPPDRNTATRPDCLMAIELTKNYREKIAESSRPGDDALTPEEQRAQQFYLEGVIYFQKGDYVKAQKRWTSCAQVNADCRAGLGKLDRLLGSSAAPGVDAAAPERAPSSSETTANQRYLEGVLYYQKGDYLKAQKRWIACYHMNADCRMGLEKIEEFLGSSTPLDEKK
jgi:tetratricopeptide (TPR) repeat protein